MVQIPCQRISFFFSVCLLLVVAACQEKPFTLGQGAPQLVGTWRLTERADSRDTLFTVRSVPALPVQSITFTADGAVSSQGKELEYYRPARYYRLETGPTSSLIRFYIGQNHANFTQALSLRSDTLDLLPLCERPCYLRFVRSR
ncbi:hypothetical protein GCM10023187_54420 [Nibrella viscosa]|uniref:Lipocalin-like domain-containing protein n=1 Tax=Nibrella viscosa TaxID=1084524 RepID=A0ABP8KZI3_9BACT